VAEEKGRIGKVADEKEQYYGSETATIIGKREKDRHITATIQRCVNRFIIHSTINFKKL
jgi:hypothetical protein